MKKAVVFYSLTGNTKIIANLFEGYDQLEVKTSDDNYEYKDIIETPDIFNYDELIFACPTHNFRMAKPMVDFVKQLPSLKGKKINLFITHFLPVKWLGGTQTLKQFKRLIEAKDGTVDHMVSINWKSKYREKLILEMFETFDTKKVHE